MKLPAQYAPLSAYAAPARDRSELWRLGAGIGLIVMLALTMATAFGALMGAVLPPAIYAAYVELTSAGPGEILFLLFGFSFFLIPTLVCVDILHGRQPLTLLGRPMLAWWQARRVAGALIVLYLVLWVLPPWDGSGLQPGLDTRVWIALMPLGLLAVLVQVSTEEVIFRGYILQQLAARYSHPAIWMVAPSVLFGALHHDPALGGNSIWLMASATLFGIAASDLTARSGSLGPAIALHLVNNASAFLLIAGQEELGDLALWIWPVDMTDPAQMRGIMMIDTGVLLCGWLAARVALRR